MTINIYNTIFSAPKNLTDKYKDIAKFMQGVNNHSQDK